MILSYIERYGQDGLVLSGLLAYVLVSLKSTTRTSTTSEESLGEGTSTKRASQADWKGHNHRNDDPGRQTIWPSVKLGLM